MPGGGASGSLLLTDGTSQQLSTGYVQYTMPNGPMGGTKFLTAATAAPNSGPLPAGVGPGGTTPLPRPRRIYWPGLLVNAVLFGAVVAVGRLLLLAPGRFLREVSRLRSGRCISCGYDLGYDFAKGCPECGWRRPSGPGRDRIPLKTEASAPPQDIRAA
jgi:hypothetical protein